MKEIKAYVPDCSNEIIFINQSDCFLHELTVKYGTQLVNDLNKYESILKDIAEKDKTQDLRLTKFRKEKAMIKWVIQNRATLAAILNNPDLKEI